MVVEIVVVLVEQADKFGSGSSHTGVPRRALTAILLIDHPKTICLCDFMEIGSLFRSGAVIDDDEFVRRHSLGENASGGAIDVFRSIVKRDHDRDRRSFPSRYHAAYCLGHNKPQWQYQLSIWARQHFWRTQFV